MLRPQRAEAATKIQQQGQQQWHLPVRKTPAGPAARAALQLGDAAVAAGLPAREAPPGLAAGAAAVQVGRTMVAVGARLLEVML